MLHDGHLHHARAWSLLRRQRIDDYRAEFEYAHPEAPSNAAAIGLAGYAGPVYYFWPMLRAVIESARAGPAAAAAISTSVEARPNARMEFAISV